MTTINRHGNKTEKSDHISANHSIKRLGSETQQPSRQQQTNIALASKNSRRQRAIGGRFMKTAVRPKPQLQTTVISLGRDHRRLGQDQVMSAVAFGGRF